MKGPFLHNMFLLITYSITIYYITSNSFTASIHLIVTINTSHKASESTLILKSIDFFLFTNFLPFFATHVFKSVFIGILTVC